jgi:PTH1 family peptidyl-tRNA hydrolase
VGIGRPGHKGEVASWVLKSRPDQPKLIEDAIAHSLKAWPDAVAGQMDKATLAINHHPTTPATPQA